MENEQMIPSFDGTKLFMKRNTPEGARAIVVVVHGLCEHQGRYDYLVEKFNALGLGCYRFDHRGHGRSEGERTYYESWTQLTDDTNVIVDLAARENPGKSIFLVGHSMGGFCVALYGLRYPGKVRGIVMSGALTNDSAGHFAGIPADCDRHARLPNTLGDGVCSVRAVVENYLADPYNTTSFTMGLRCALRDGVAYLREHYQDFAVPVLMLHGEKDSLVSAEDTCRGFARVASDDRQMKIYGGLFHEVFNEYCRDEVISDAAGWILNRI